LTAPTLTDEQVGGVLELMGDADSVELKTSLPESDHYSAASALDMDPLDAQLRQVYFFDTPDLTLNRHGIVLRGRRVQGKGGDSIVKLRPVTPADLPAKLREAPGFGVEIDAMPGAYVCSGTLKRTVESTEVRQVGAGALPAGGLLSKAQRKFLFEHAPDGFSLDDLSVLGPILVLKLKFKPEEFERRLVAELWLFPDNSRILELSTKCEPHEAFLAAAETRAFLTQRGIDFSGEQQAKTATALEYFSGRLAGSASP
jgi:hypothetical protein